MGDARRAHVPPLALMGSRSVSAETSENGIPARADEGRVRRTSSTPARADEACQAKLNHGKPNRPSVNRNGTVRRDTRRAG